MSWVLSLLTSKIGGGMAWVQVISLSVTSGWLLFSKTRLESKVEKQEVEISILEQEKQGLVAMLEQAQVHVGAITLQVKNCHEAVEYMRENTGRVKTVIKRAHERDGVGPISKESSDEIIGTYNTLLR